MESCEDRRDPRPGSEAAFTLVELLIVVVILAILSAVVLPRFGGQRAEAVASSLKASVMQVTMVLESRKQATPDGSYPPSIEPAWFVGGYLPHHPDAMAGVPPVETVQVAGLMDPRTKLIVPGSAGAYWYNAATGAFRARVKILGSLAETQEFYDLVNGVSAAPAPEPAAAPAPQ
ncbi:MAG TPA: type II secretion system protein [Planctomycetota bacterium]|nr:type II secretion system protein [Planctomycetota bacterium]